MDAQESKISTALVAAVEAEIAEIGAKLAELSALQERQARLKAWLELTRQVFPAAAGVANSETAKPQPTAEIARRLQGQGLNWPLPSLSEDAATRSKRPMKELIEDAAAVVYKAKGALGSRDMLASIEAMGIEVRGLDKAGTIATVLSKSPKFKNDRSAGGWVFIGEQPAQEPLV